MFQPIEVKALDDYQLWIKYNDGVEGVIDLSHLAGRGVFTFWDDSENFQKVSIGDSGEIMWSHEIDLCPDAIYIKITGKNPDELFSKLKAEEADA